MTNKETELLQQITELEDALGLRDRALASILSHAQNLKDDIPPGSAGDKMEAEIGHIRNIARDAQTTTDKPSVSRETSPKTPQNRPERFQAPPISCPDCGKDFPPTVVVWIDRLEQLHTVGCCPHCGGFFVDIYEWISQGSLSLAEFGEILDRAGVRNHGK